MAIRAIGFYWFFFNRSIDFFNPLPISFNGLTKATQMSFINEWVRAHFAVGTILAIGLLPCL